MWVLLNLLEAIDGSSKTFPGHSLREPSSNIGRPHQILQFKFEHTLYFELQLKIDHRYSPSGPYPKRVGSARWLAVD